MHEVFADRASIVRPGLIVGPHDPTDRFTYWPDRVARGGEMLAPGTPDRAWQFVDVRDGAAFALEVAEHRLPGPFNVTNSSTAGDVLAGANATWIDDAFLVERGVGEWMELPLWVAQDGELGALHTAEAPSIRRRRARPGTRRIQVAFAPARTSPAVEEFVTL